MKLLTTIFLTAILLFQPFVALAAENKVISNIEAEAKRQTKDQYTYKKVNKIYDPYLITITNTTGKTILLTSDTQIAFETKNNETIPSATRRNMYRKTRSRDVGKYCGFALPGSAIAGGIIGITFGLGIPVAIGVIILSVKPTANASKINAEFARDIYDARKLPLRMEPESVYKIRVLVPKHVALRNIVITNVVYEKSKLDEKIDIRIPVEVVL